MMGYDEIIGPLRQKVFEVLVNEGIDQMPGDEDSLVDSGIIDSLAVVAIAVYLETEYGIDFSVVLFDVNHFESIATMARFVESVAGKA
ncbi:MAG: acyl carrier protein [Desulfuromonadales bacterium]|nr:acyl carrier protein [Desulfuromonadales bacterium]